jgi:hypothetical protein
MTYTTAAGFRDALEQRLLATARDTSVPVVRLRKLVAFGSSTRVKDLIDLALIASLSSLDAGALRSALLATFDARGTHPLPSALPQPPAEWRVAYRRMAAELGLNDDVNIGYEEVRSFLDPVLAGVVPDDACWNPARRTW